MIDNGYGNKSGMGFLVVIFIIISFIVTGGMLLLLDDGPLQSARGGCFVNFGTEGCNTYITQEITQQPDTLSSPLFIVAMIAIVFLGIGFLIVTRKRV